MYIYIYTDVIIRTMESLKLITLSKVMEQYFVFVVKRVRDIETEEMLEELHGKIRDLDKQNQHLKEKVYNKIKVYIIQKLIST